MGRRKHSAEFKRKVAIEALKEQKTLAQIAKEYQIHPIQVSEWKRQLLDGCVRAFESGVIRDTREAEIEVLERKVGRLTIENDYLKKKLGQ